MINYDYHTVKNNEFLTSCKSSPEEIIIIENFPNNDHVLDTFLAPLGTPLQESRNQEEGIIFEVTVKHKEGCFTSYATSNLFFPVHTENPKIPLVPVSFHYIS